MIQDGGKVLAFCVSKPFGHSLDLVEFRASDGDTGLDLLATMHRFAIDHGLTEVNCWAPRHRPLHRDAEKLGMTHREPITYFGFRPFDSELGCLESYSSWNLHMGNSDVY